MPTPPSPTLRRRLLVAPVAISLLALSAPPAAAVERTGHRWHQQSAEEPDFFERCWRMLAADRDAEDDAAQQGEDAGDGGSADSSDDAGSADSADSADSAAPDETPADAGPSDEAAAGGGSEGDEPDAEPEPSPAPQTDAADGDAEADGPEDDSADSADAGQDSADSSDDAPSGELAELYDAFDEARADNGLPPLERDTALEEKAQGWSETMARTGDFEHNPEGGAENIYMSSGDSGAGAIDAWLGSPGHRANMLNPGYEAVGLGIATGDGGTYVTQNFS